MATTKIINSIKVDSTYLGKIVSIDANGNVAPVTVKQQFIPLTDGTEDLTQTTVGTYTYTLADFVGTGLDTDNINSLVIYMFCNDAGSSGGNSKISVYIGGQWVVACYAAGYGGGNNDNCLSIATIPIVSGDTEFSIRVDEKTYAAEFTILGANQLIVE